MYQQDLRLSGTSATIRRCVTPQMVFPWSRFQPGRQPALDRARRTIARENALVPGDRLAQAGRNRQPRDCLTKGRQVLVVGELEEPRTFTDKNGTIRVSLDVTAGEIRFLGRPKRRA